MTEDLRERLGRLDPMHAGVPTNSTTTASSRQLLEEIMSTPIKERTEQASSTPRFLKIAAVTAVGAAVLAIGAGLVFGGVGRSPNAGSPTMELTALAEDLMASCIAFSAEELDRVAEVAFAGTVTRIEGSMVTLTVDRWYRGGDTAEVTLNAPTGMEALIGGIPFETGNEYLITAQAGTVNYCGFSGAATPEYRAAFETAFARG